MLASVNPDRGYYDFDMELNREPNTSAGSTAVEFLNGVSDTPEQGRSTTRAPLRTAAIVAMVAALYLGFLFAPGDEGLTTARVHPVGVYFGNPFGVEWTELQNLEPSAVTPAGLVPMAGEQPPCVGFGRPDWPPEKRHPSVARCIHPAGVEQLLEDKAVGVWTIVAGTDTWYFLFFAKDVVEVDARSEDGAPIDPSSIYRAGMFAAVLIPTDSTGLSLTWKLQTGGPFSCHFDRLTAGPPSCEPPATGT